MPAHALDFDRAQAQPGDVVLNGELRGVIKPARSADHVIVDWSGVTAPRRGANTWILTT